MTEWVSGSCSPRAELPEDRDQLPALGLQLPKPQPAHVHWAVTSTGCPASEVGEVHSYPFPSFYTLAPVAAETH